MILPVFILFFLIAAFFIIYGYIAKDDAFRIIGITFIFLSGLAIEPATTGLSLIGPVQYENGTITSINTTISGNNTFTVESAVPQYVNYTNHALGFWLAISGVFGIIIIMTDRRKG